MIHAGTPRAEDAIGVECAWPVRAPEALAQLARRAPTGRRRGTLPGLAITIAIVVLAIVLLSLVVGAGDFSTGLPSWLPLHGM